MKIWVNTLLPLLLLMMVSSVVQAQPYAYTNYYGIWYYTTNNGVITITGRDGSIPFVNIPSRIYDLPVTSIGDRALSSSMFMTSVTIPAGVTNIGYMAFDSCQQLVDVTIPPGVTSMGLYAFDCCRSLRSVSIPTSLSYIPAFAFASCTSLTSVLIPTNITSIGQSAFCMCSGLTNVTVPNSITDIGSSAFYGCSGLNSVTLPPLITAINNNTFYRCSGLTSLVIPNSVTSIGIIAFAECTSLTNLIIPSSVTTISTCAFSACSSLTSVYFQGYVPYLDSYAFQGDNKAVFYYAPHLATQPFNQIISLQTTTSFAVTATGTPPLTYQWRFNDTSLPGETNSTLMLHSALLANSGAYTVIVTNAYGSVTSDPAMLTVLPLVIGVPKMLANGQLQFDFDAATGVNYEVQYSTDLKQWLPWVTVGGNGGHPILIDPNTSGSQMRFYRISPSPQ